MTKPAVKIIRTIKKLIISLLLVAAWYGCSTSRPKPDKVSGNKSHYHMQRFVQNQDRDSAIVIIHAKRSDHGILSSFIIKVNDTDIYEIHEDTTAIISLSPGKYRFLFLEPLSYKIKTKKIDIGIKDSLRIDFYSELNPIE